MSFHTFCVYVLSVLCLALVLTTTTATKVPFSRHLSSLASPSLLDNDTVQEAYAGLTGSSSSRTSSDYALAADNSSTGGVITKEIGVAQAFITLALILLVVGAVMGAVWYRHRQRDGGAAPFSFSLPSFRRSRTHGSGVVGGSGSNNERLLAGQAGSDDALLRNRPGGRSLV